MGEPHRANLSQSRYLSDFLPLEAFFGGAFLAGAGAGRLSFFGAFDALLAFELFGGVDDFVAFGVDVGGDVRFGVAVLNRVEVPC